MRKICIGILRPLSGIVQLHDIHSIKVDKTLLTMRILDLLCMFPVELVQGTASATNFGNFWKTEYDNEIYFPGQV